MLPYKGGRLTPVQNQLNSMTPLASPVTCSARSFSQSPLTLVCTTPINYDIDMFGNCGSGCSSDCSGNCTQTSCNPFFAEMEKFFSIPTMAITFMPCVCMPDYPVDEGTPKKICRRCSVAQLSSLDQPESPSGSSTVAIDNKIEQAMDLVKSHLMFAVREEVEVLKEQIAELIERNNQLEYENGILRAAASPETLAKLAQPRQPLPSSSS